MTVYLDLVIGLNFAVDFLLLLAANRMCGYPLCFARTAAAATFGGVYGGACLLPGFSFLSSSVWRVVSLCLMAVIAFGWHVSTARRGGLFAILSMALGGIAIGNQDRGIVCVLLGAAGVLVFCNFAFLTPATRRYVPVTLRHGQKEKILTALCDTGNTLKDPITGRQVLVVGADVAADFFCLTEEDLRCPIETIQRLHTPGLRLIPYRAVGQPNGMLLAIKMDEVIIGKEKTGGMVAFAPQSIGKAEGYQALTGGIV